MNESHGGTAWCKRYKIRVIDTECQYNCHECKDFSVLSDEDVLGKEKK